MKEKLIGDMEYGFRVITDDDKNVTIKAVLNGIDSKDSEIKISKDLMYLLLNNFLKTDYI